MPCVQSRGAAGGRAVDNFFRRNLLALAKHNPALCSRLEAANTARSRYRFLEARSGELVPALADKDGKVRPLHSTVDPAKEAARLAGSLREGNSPSGGGFVVFLGLGAGFTQAAALGSGLASHALVIDFDIDGIAELLCRRDYTAILSDPRCTLLVDPSLEHIEKAILERYYPALYGGITALPLRARTETDKESFAAASGAVQKTIEKVSADYSVQAHFGMRWFGNIIRNIAAVGEQKGSAPAILDAAICAAGPSLDLQLPALAEKRQKLFVIAADTSLGALLRHGIIPDAAVSIDCQHYSTYHFTGLDCRDIPLFLDIAGPPLLSGFSAHPFFFSGGHPLAEYVSRNWRPLPLLDTSGGNVTHACLSLAESLGARQITVYGADFSYPAGKVYARGTYIHPLFERRQSRLRPLEAQLSAFLYRTPFLPPESPGHSPCKETEPLRFYRNRFEQKASAMAAEVSAAPGIGIPLAINRNRSESSGAGGTGGVRFTSGEALVGTKEFLEQYRRDVEGLPSVQAGTCAAAYPHSLAEKQREVFVTLLPLAAAIRHRQPELDASSLIEEVKRYCVNEVDRVLGITVP
ncbi:MAG: DUF115 domain-containing protein [Treponema sp.]|nr:DUF115 domain-containing protein [Treponema sp.]